MDIKTSHTLLIRFSLDCSHKTVHLSLIVIMSLVNKNAPMAQGSHSVCVKHLRLLVFPIFEYQGGARSVTLVGAANYGSS